MSLKYKKILQLSSLKILQNNIHRNNKHKNKYYLKIKIRI